MKSLRSVYRLSAVLLLLAGCSSNDMTTTPSMMSAADSGTHPMAMGGPQAPAMGATEITAWLAAGSYKSWSCEPAVHAARAPSPHGFNRICSNDILAAAVGSAADWPKGSAAVKELLTSADSTTPVGYAVYSKTEDASNAGANWYWYEVVPANSQAPHDASGVVADGLGNGGPALAICVSCHGAAGSDAAHTPSMGGHDQVYTPVGITSSADAG
jgi:hypothetical protein